MAPGTERVWGAYRVVKTLYCSDLMSHVGLENVLILCKQARFPIDFYRHNFPLLHGGGGGSFGSFL